MASNTASTVGITTAVPGQHSGGQTGSVGPSAVQAGSSGSTLGVAGSAPPGGPAPVFHHEFLEASAAAAAAAAAVCFCHRFLNPFGGGPMALTTTGYVLLLSYIHLAQVSTFLN